nr:glycosyltransferase [Caulobacter hibisci]
MSGVGDRIKHYELHLVLLDDLPEARAFPAYVIKHTLDGRGSALRSVLRLNALLARLKPDLVVSFLVRANLASGLAAWAQGFPLIICERMHLSSHLEARYKPTPLAVLRLALRAAYRNAKVVLGVSSGVTTDLLANFGVPPCLAKTIFNPYPLERIRQAAAEPPAIALPADFLVAVGRLEPSKNFAQLIDAYAASNPPSDLVILGDGSLRPALHAQIRRLGLEGRIHMPGFLANPFSVVGRANAYISASLNEGFPNAMVEAMVLGLPILASDCPSGPAEILDGAVDPQAEAPALATYGLLSPLNRTAPLAAGIARLTDPILRSSLSELARTRAETFAAPIITEQYWTLFEATSAGG